MRRVLASALILVVLVVGLGPMSARAHSGKQSYLYISVYDDAVEGRVEMPAVDLARALGTEIPQRARDARAILGDLTAPVRAYVAEHMALADDAGPWNIDLSPSLQVLPTENGLYIVLAFVVADDFDEAPRSFTADFSVIIESDPEKDALLIIEDDWASATFDNGSEPLLGFSTGLNEQRVELGGASTIDSMLAIRGIGTDAVRTGIDSMLIVVAVVLSTVMLSAVRRDRVVSSAQMARRLGTGLLALVAGHSLTLWFVGSTILTPTERLTGALAAAGLGLMAGFGLLAWWQPARWSNATPVIAIAGLLQGFALGHYFDLQDLERRRTFTSLLAFQIGVEIAVVILAVLVAVPLILLRRTRVASIVTVGIGIALAGYAVGWFLERLFDTDLPIEEVANPYRVWPRNLVFVAIAVVGAWGIRFLDARADRLRPIDGGPTPDRSSSEQEPEMISS